MKMAFLQHFGNRLREFREFRCLSASEVAVYLGLSLSGVSRIESGEYLPKKFADMLPILCDLYQVSPADLFSGYHWEYTPVGEEAFENAA